MSAPPAAWVLDTNAVLDWLVFDDPAMRAAAAWLRDGRASWLHCPDMLDELSDVLGREAVLRRAPVPAAALLERLHEAAQACGRLLETPPRCAWSCADPDDQVFVDLAAHARAELLITRDKALLALASRARASGLRIARPADLQELA